MSMFRVVAGATMLLFLAAGSLGAGENPAPAAATPVPLVDRSLLLAFLADNSTATLVDARSPEEYAARHVTGAINIPYDRLDEHLDQLPADRAEPIIVYCRSGKRAALLQEQLVGRGYGNVHVLPPRQLFWTDEVMVFNCGVEEQALASPVAAETGARAAGAAAAGTDQK